MALHGQRREDMATGYEAPVRRSLIDSDELMGVPRMAVLGLTLLAGLLFLQFLPGEWKGRVAVSGGFWVFGFALMRLLSARDPQWWAVLVDRLRSPSSLEV